MKIFEKHPLIIPVLGSIELFYILSYYDVAGWTRSLYFISTSIALLAIGVFVCFFGIRNIKGWSFYLWIALGLIFLISFLSQLSLLGDFLA
jgi:hypothetical protein